MAVAEPVEVGNERQAGGPRAAQVLVRRVEDGLGVGHVMDRGDHAMLDADAFVNDLHHRGEAVRGAGGGGEQVVLVWFVKVVVHAHHDVERAGFHRRRDDDFFHAGLEIGVELLRRAEFPAGFEHDVHAEIAPRHLGEILVAGVAEGFAVDENPIRLAADFAVPSAVDRVELDADAPRRRRRRRFH